jgi:hypothetical protein
MGLTKATWKNLGLWLFSFAVATLFVAMVRPAPLEYLLSIPLFEQWRPILGTVFLTIIFRVVLDHPIFCDFEGATPESGE